MQPDPLRTGLAVKPPGAPMYSAGKDGDLRDIWRRVTGEIPLEKKASSSGTATIMTAFGKEDISEHNIPGVSKEIAIIGKHLQEHNAKRVAIYLPNSLEFLVVLFAGAFYGFTPILIPYNQPHATLIDLLQAARADSLIAQAGSFPLADVTRSVPSLRQIVWTVEKTSRHMDWSEVPEGIGGKVDVSVWHELVQDSKHTEDVLPSDGAKAPGVVFLWQEAVGKPAEIVEFTQQVSSSPFLAAYTLTPPEHRCCRRLTHHLSAYCTPLLGFGHLPPCRHLYKLLLPLPHPCGALLPFHRHPQLGRRPWCRLDPGHARPGSHHRGRVRRDCRKRPQHHRCVRRRGPQAARSPLGVSRPGIWSSPHQQPPDARTSSNWQHPWQTALGLHL
jgi:hypothetical protein